MPASEVKGAWFVTARRYVIESHGHSMFDRYVRAAPEASRAALRDPVVSHWYPEDAMRDALESFHGIVCSGDDARFVEAMESCTALGTNWFLKVLVSVTSPRYLIRQVPAAMRQLRRGTPSVTVDVRDRDATVRFTGLPNSDDPRYRLATPAVLRSLLRFSAGSSARATLVAFDRTTQVVELSF